jgi:hypothetical protein
MDYVSVARLFFKHDPTPGVHIHIASSVVATHRRTDVVTSDIPIHIMTVRRRTKEDYRVFTATMMVEDYVFFQYQIDLPKVSQTVAGWMQIHPTGKATLMLLSNDARSIGITVRYVQNMNLCRSGKMDCRVSVLRERLITLLRPGPMSLSDIKTAYSALYHRELIPSVFGATYIKDLLTMPGIMNVVEVWNQTDTVQMVGLANYIIPPTTLVTERVYALKYFHCVDRTTKAILRMEFRKTAQMDIELDGSCILKMYMLRHLGTLHTALERLRGMNTTQMDVAKIDQVLASFVQEYEAPPRISNDRDRIIRRQ